LPPAPFISFRFAEALVPQDPFPRSALAENRAGRITAEQLAALRMDAGKSKRSGLLAGLAISAFGLFILWGTLAGRVPGSKLQSLGVGALFTVVGVLFLGAGGMTRGTRAEAAASESTVLEPLEGPFRRRREERLVETGPSHAKRGSARYLYYLYVGDRRFSVGEAAFDASPDDGIVRAYLLPGSDVIVNLERIADAPPTATEVRAAEVLDRRLR
jgi:hypothetical protein